MPERYEIRGKIARGGIGAIFRAHDNLMGREVAIKRLLPLEETHLNESQEDSLRREAAALARFQHPNVVTIYAFESDADGPFVVMEMVEGETLKEAVERAALTVDDFVEMTRQVLDPLVAAQELSLLHRDIKPANIMLTWLASGRFQVKILDFGLAKFSQAPSLQTLDQTGAFLGSIDYLAPEQLELQPLDQRTDLYSLGCVLYYCLAQRPPFEGENVSRTMQNHLSHRVEPLIEIRPDVPRSIADWVMKLISREPAQRPRDAMAALREFEAAIRDAEPSGPLPVAIPVWEEEPVAGRASEEPVAVPPPVRPAVAPKVLKRGSAPVRLKTGPRAPAARQTETDQARAPRLRGTGPARPATRSSGAPEPGFRRGWVILLIALALGALAVAVLARRDRTAGGKAGAAEPVRAKSAIVDTPPAARPLAAAAGAVPDPPPAPDAPPLANPVVTDPVADPPVVTEGLVAHFAASDAAMGPDHQSPARPGQRVTRWGNLAAPSADARWLAVDPGGTASGPELVAVTPDEVPELATPAPMLRFGRSNRLVSQGGGPGPGAMAGTALTTILVFKAGAPAGPMIRFDSDAASPFVAWDLTPAGLSTRMAKGTLAPTIEARMGGGRSRLVILSHVWEGEKVEQRLHLTLPGGHQALLAAGDAPFKPAEVNRYSIGAIPSGPSGAAFEGLVAECLVYNRALADADREQVERQLATKYLAGDPVLTVDVATPQPNGVIPAPRNPGPPAAVPPVPLPETITTPVVAHFAASAATLGHDLVGPARFRQRVMAWGNLADGAHPDHLLAFERGREGATPLLIPGEIEAIPGLGAAQPLLRFSPGDALEGKGNAHIQSGLDDRELGMFLVGRFEPGGGRLLQLLSGQGDPAVTFEAGGGVVAAALLDGPEPRKVAVTARTDRLLMIAWSWRAGEGGQRLWAREAEGSRTAPAASGGPAGPLAVSGYRMGGEGTGFGGEVAALLLFGKALSEPEERAVEEYLSRLYFTARP